MRNEQWLIYCLPFLVYMAVGMLEPAAPIGGVFEQPHGLTSFIAYNLYPYIYSLKIGLTCLAIAWVWPGYRQFPFKLNGLALVVGVVGAVLWVAINKGQQRIPHQFLTDMGLGALTKLGLRPGFNPLDQMRDDPALAWSFLAIRFFGLVLVVPVIEEFFLRGFVMRFVVEVDWWKVPFGKVTPLALVAGTGVPMLMHPQELLAAFVWFSMVTCLMVRTRNIWDCILAHSVTNLLMGLWVLYSGDWWLM
jgi:CAAX prenyl protease-like protein